MSRLAARMTVPFEWKRPLGTCAIWENPGLPSGYTYLLQLIAHDLVQTSIPFSLVEAALPAVKNARSAPLRLETIYGGGPLVCPAGYALDDLGDEGRTKLRLGRMRDNGHGHRLPFRDLARFAGENLDGKPRHGLADVLIADPRNDDHAIISQLTAFFHLLHNAIVDCLPVPPSPGAVPLPAAYRRFLCARDAVTLMYHTVIKRDLMPRLLRREVLDAYLAGAERLVEDRETEWRVPLEFSHAAFRFGHSMIRNEYRMNDVNAFDLVATLNRTSAREPANMPLDRDWAVRWSLFFDIGGSRPNLSRRIGPEFSVGLLDEQLFGSIDATGRLGLMYRDLMSGSYLDLWSVSALVEELRRKRPALIGRSRLLSDAAYRFERLSAWLSAGAGVAGLTPDDVHALAGDPPLLLFVLFEAADECEGATLGTLGSLIVAKVLFDALRRSRLPAELACPDDLRGALASLSGSYFGVNHFEWSSEVTSMSDLVLLTGALSGAAAEPPAFV